MLSPCERQLLFSYLCNAASRIHHSSPEAEKLAEWVVENWDLALTDNSEELEAYRPYKHEEMSEREWRSLREALEGGLSACGGSPPDRTARRLQTLGRKLDLADEDVAILELLLRCHVQPVLESLAESLGDHRRSRCLNISNPYLVCLLGLPSGRFLSRLTADAPLVGAGLVSVEHDGDLEIVHRLHRLIHLPDDDGLDVRRLLLDSAPPGELEWSDFDHVAEERDYILRIVEGSLRTGKGLNVLVYGPPGTGKTEFCKTLAARLGADLYSVGETDEDGDEPARHERLQDLRFAQRLLAGGKGSVLLFDEMEDLLADRGPGWMPFHPFASSRLRSGGSKAFMNRLLERAPVPTLWTSNSARETCSAVLRRMNFALELRPPPCRTRARIWRRELERHGIEATEEDAGSLAREFDVTPGLASGAVAAAGLCGGDLAAVRRGVRSLSRVISGDRPPAAQGAPERFDLGLIQADVDPAGLAGRLEATGEKRFSLCLQGPPGTGKSAFVRYLAERLGLQVTQKRASDLMSMWVGATEQQIAAAFAEARAEESILVFDEADSLLADRRGAVRSWEVSQVNEMLTWMESHPLPFACTTNFGEHLDPATLRRFTFKVSLDYLTAVQSKAAFRAFFDLEAPPEVEALVNLTPGDFAVVRRKAEILGHLRDPEGLAGLLRAECEAKPGLRGTLGFGS